jgi:RNA-directed DNA polymerase
MRVERRSPAFRPWKQVNSQGEEPVPKEKSFDIPKQLVWDAYQRVKANRGAAGVDGESLTMFEKNLKGNLYKIWNRMASGSYLPPPVRLVGVGGHSESICAVRSGASSYEDPDCLLQRR